MRAALLFVTVLGLVSAAPSSPEPVRYRLGLLERGPGWTPVRTPHTDSVQAGHMANIRRMADLGVLRAAGPFENGGVLRGLFVFAPSPDGTNADLDSLLVGDPAIAEGRLVCRLDTWLAPPGIGDDYRTHAAARKARGLAPDSMITYSFAMIRRGPRYTSNEVKGLTRLLEKSRAHAAALEREGTLIYKGGIEGTGDLRGVYVFAADSAATVQAMQKDPAVRAGRFSVQVLTWWHAWGTIPGH